MDGEGGGVKHTDKQTDRPLASSYASHQGASSGTCHTSCLHSQLLTTTVKVPITKEDCICRRYWEKSRPLLIRRTAIHRHYSAASFVADWPSYATSPQGPWCSFSEASKYLPAIHPF